MAYERLTVDGFLAALKNNDYQVVAGARRAVGRMPWSEKDKEKARAAICSHFNVPPQGASVPAPSAKNATKKTAAAPAVAKGKPGRKPKAAAAAEAPAPKGKPGRKSGSGKKTASVAAPVNQAPKGKPGRKPKAAVAATTPAATAEAPKERAKPGPKPGGARRGRPPVALQQQGKAQASASGTGYALTGLDGAIQVTTSLSGLLNAFAAVKAVESSVSLTDIQKIVDLAASNVRRNMTPHINVDQEVATAQSAPAAKVSPPAAVVSKVVAKAAPTVTSPQKIVAKPTQVVETKEEEEEEEEEPGLTTDDVAEEEEEDAADDEDEEETTADPVAALNPSELRAAAAFRAAANNGPKVKPPIGTL
jgi:hypothetical protein